MVYVKRDAEGRLIAVSLEDDGSGGELGAGNRAERELLEKLLRDSRSELSESDLSLSRVLEDLVELLVDKGVIRFTDLPEAARAKLEERKGARVSMRIGRSLLDEDNDMI